MEFNVDYETPQLLELRKEYYVADMHSHTRHSHDSNTPVKELLWRAQKLGIHFAITDHNQIAGVIEAYDLPGGPEMVIPSIEITTKENRDVLVYFYSVMALQRFYDDQVKPRMKHRSSLRMNKTQFSMHDLLPALEREKCVIALPHPFCAKPKNSYALLHKEKNEHLLDYLHAIEVINETMTHQSNLAALGWAVQLKKGAIAGSDAHISQRLGMAVTAAKAKTHTEFLDAIRKGRVLVAGSEINFTSRVAVAFRLLREKGRLLKNIRVDKEGEGV